MVSQTHCARARRVPSLQGLGPTRTDKGLKGYPPGFYRAAVLAFVDARRLIEHLHRAVRVVPRPLLAAWRGHRPWLAAWASAVSAATCAISGISAIGRPAPSSRAET